VGVGPAQRLPHQEGWDWERVQWKVWEPWLGGCWGTQSRLSVSAGPAAVTATGTTCADWLLAFHPFAAVAAAVALDSNQHAVIERQVVSETGGALVVPAVRHVPRVRRRHALLLSRVLAAVVRGPVSGAEELCLPRHRQARHSVGEDSALPVDSQRRRSAAVHTVAAVVAPAAAAAVA
jgi:hypothetical protein